MKANIFLGDLKAIGRNVDWLTIKMKERGCVISRSAVYRKLKGTSEFSVSEIKAISAIMNYSNDKIFDIFFEELVS